MNRDQFTELRDLPDKVIASDIEFLPDKAISTTLSFDQVEVENGLGYELVLNGSYIPNIPALKFNFVVNGVGAICRIEINGVVHKPVGRTHKHALIDENCPRKNLPHADASSRFRFAHSHATANLGNSMSRIRHPTYGKVR